MCPCLRRLPSAAIRRRDFLCFLAQEYPAKDTFLNLTKFDARLFVPSVDLTAVDSPLQHRVAPDLNILCAGCRGNRRGHVGWRHWLSRIGCYDFLIFVAVEFLVLGIDLKPIAFFALE